MSVKFSNNAYGTLNAGISSSDTSLTLSSGQGARFPTLASGDYFYATLIDTSNNLEIIKVTARSTDVLTIVRGQESTTARTYAIGDRVELRVTAGGLTDAANPYDKDTSSTGSFALPIGTTAQEPTAADTEGHIRYDSDLGTVTFSNGTGWFKIAAAVAQLSSVSGNVYAGATSTLTLTGSGFLAANLIVNFTQASDAIDEDVTVTPTSDTSATVTVPSAVYSNVTAGNVVSVSVTNSDGMSSAPVSVTALGTPSGGTVTTSGSYRIHTFTSSGTFTNTLSGSSFDYLLVAGGGGAGGDLSGGAGAGGLISGTTTLSGTNSYSVVIGAGGSGSSENASRGIDADGISGSNSTALSLTAIGGGASTGYNDGTNSATAGLSGGSGGGASGNSSGTNGGGSGTSGQGNAGGNAIIGSPYTAGGGGGAGSVGGSASVNVAGDGGIGLASSITGTSTYYAGGGGGGNYDGSNNQSTGGAGGLGGGGNGGYNIANGQRQGQSGSANTGGGGGGGTWSGSDPTVGGNGGSGVFIIRYQLP